MANEGDKKLQSKVDPSDVQLRLEKKVLAIIDQLSQLRQDAKLTQSELADRIGMDKGQFSKLMRGTENMTLETVARFESALDHEILVTPYDYEEQLVDDTARLTAVVEAALNFNPEFSSSLRSRFTAAMIQDGARWVHVVTPPMHRWSSKGPSSVREAHTHSFNTLIADGTAVS